MVANSKFKNHLEVLLLDGCTRVKSSSTLIPIVNGKATPLFFRKLKLLINVYISRL